MQRPCVACVAIIRGRIPVTNDLHEPLELFTQPFHSASAWSGETDWKVIAGQTIELRVRSDCCPVASLK